MPILGIVILAALCGIAMGNVVPEQTVNLDKISISNKPNPYFGDWSVTLTPGSPLNTVKLEVPVKMDLPENIMITWGSALKGKEFPPIETSFCKGIIEESVGKPIMDQGRDPFPKSCPIKKGVYVIPKYTAPIDKLPKPLPPGKFSVFLKVYAPGEEPFVTADVDGEIAQKVLK